MKRINHYTDCEIYNPSTGKKFKINGYVLKHRLSGIGFFLGRLYNSNEKMQYEGWAVYDIKTGLPVHLQFSGSRESAIRYTKKLLDSKVKESGVEGLQEFLDSEFERLQEEQKLRR